jgi:hypothetical protein
MCPWLHSTLRATAPGALTISLAGDVPIKDVNGSSEVVIRAGHEVLFRSSPTAIGCHGDDRTLALRVSTSALLRRVDNVSRDLILSLRSERSCR